MSESERSKELVEQDTIISTTIGPLVFISHDAKDAELAEAFSKLLKSVSAGMIKTFRSSDKKGAEGIDFGDEWYKRLMAKLQSTTDVICLFTEHSLDRPWILFEAGVAKGKLNTAVVGIAIGVPLARVSTGPFYQFQNMDDSEIDLTKLIHQLAKRIPGLELDSDVIKVQVATFKKTEVEILKKVTARNGKKEKAESEDNPISKLAEEMKALPSRVAERLAESGDLIRRRRIRHFHPMMLEEMIHMVGDPKDPVGIMMAASIIRDDAPWLYEIAMEVYRVAKSGDVTAIENEIKRLEHFSESIRRGAFMEEFASSREAYIMGREFPAILQNTLRLILERQKPSPTRQRIPRKQLDQS